MTIALYRIFLGKDGTVGLDERLRDTYQSFAHSTNIS